MGRAKPVVLATRVFRTMDEAKGYFRDLANRYEPGETISCSGDVRLLLELNRYRLPDRIEPSEDIAEFFANTMSPATEDFDPGHRTIWFKRYDGTEAMFCYLAAIDEIAGLTAEPFDDVVARSHAKLVGMALRSSVADLRLERITEVLAAGDYHCPRTGALVTDPGSAMLTYLPNWRTFIETFIVGAGGWLEIAVEHEESKGMVLADPELTEAWRAYWIKNARTQVESRRATRS